MTASVETMAYGRGVPWHRIGVKTPEPLSTAEDMLRYAGLDWEVAKSPLYTSFRGETISVPRKWATVRQSDGAVLGVVGDAYQVVQNREAFSFADHLVDSGGAKYETAGSLYGGAKVFLSMELPEGVRIAGDESPVKPYILVTNSHDGSYALTAAVVTVRVVCANTLTLALRGAQRTWRIRHTGTVDGKIAAEREALGITFEYLSEFKAEAERLVLKSVVEAQVEDILKKAFPQPEKRPGEPVYAQVLDVYRTSANLDPIRGTAWGVVQATAEYLDHHATYRGRRASADEVMADSILYDGTAAARQQTVYELVRAL